MFLFLCFTYHSTVAHKLILLDIDPLDQTWFHCIALEAMDQILQMRFTNRIDEAQDHMAALSRTGIQVYPVHYWPRKNNIANLVTKGLAKLKDVASGTVWKLGPKTLCFPMKTWPALREFQRNIPEDEV